MTIYCDILFLHTSMLVRGFYMSNIIKTKEELFKTRRCLEIFRDEGFNGDTLMVAAHRLMPRDKSGFITEYKIKDQGNKPVQYVNRYNRMEFAIDKCNEWINANIGTLMRKYNISDERVFRSYLTMYLLMHETERMYLHLMGKGYIPSPCETVKGSYSVMNELILTPSLNPVKQVRRVVSLIPYNKHPERYIFERNANVETYSGLLSLAADEGNKEMAVLYRGLATKSMLVGYETDNKGCLYHTFKDLMMLDYYDKINKKEKLDPNDAARFGLEIPEETRKKMLTRK